MMIEDNAKAQRPAANLQRSHPHFDVRCSRLISFVNGAAPRVLRGRRLPLITALLLLVSAIATARADDGGIAVSGTATVKARPTEVEIVGVITGEGELANDASVKFHDSRKKALAALENLKNPDLSVESEGSDVEDSVDPQQQMRLMQGQTNEQVKAHTQITERFKIKLKNADKLEQDKLLETVLNLIDTSRDAGLTIGTSQPTNYYQWQMQMQNGGGNNGALVQYKIPDTTDLQTEACRQAIADARAKAQRIADLSGVKLGRVLSVKDYSATDTAPNSGGNDHAVDKEAVSSSIGDIPLTVHVQVLFEIEK